MNRFFKSKFFLIGLGVRLAFLPFFGSHYLKELFIPFLDSAVLHPLTNPWSLMPPHHFPYGSVLFAILYVPRLLAHALLGDLALGHGLLGISLVKLPLLGLDIVLLFTLARIAKDRASHLMLFYWLNPIAIYITYVHGQLDLAVMTFCLMSLSFLTSRKTISSAIAMAAATLCKFHVVAIVPFILVYLWNRQFAAKARKEIVAWLVTWAGLSALGFLPLLLADHLLYASTSSPEAFRLFAAQINFGSGQIVYFGVMIVLAVLGRLCISTRISHHGMIFGSGAVFGTLLLVTNTMPGWYFWVLPFLSLLFTLYLNVPRSLYWSMNVLYLVYFGVLQSFPDFFGPLPNGVGFTLLQTALGGTLVTMWALVVRSEAILQGRAKPVMLGLAGDSGSGKDHLSGLLKDLFNARNTVVIEGDDYHKWERFHERWNDYTHLNPRANYLAEMAFHTAQLTKGIPILQSHYDHTSGLFTPPQETKPSKTVILQGLHTFYLRSMRRNLDLKIFLAPDKLVRLSWKLKRDVTERGYPQEKVLDSIAKRETDSKIHIASQMKFADWVIEWLPTEPITEEATLSGKQPKLALRFTVWNDAPVTELMAAIGEISGCKVEFDFLQEDIDRIVLNVYGNPSAAQVGSVAEKVFPNLRLITRGREAPTWREGPNGIIQLMTLALLSEKTVGQQA